MEKENNNEMINQLENFINEFNELNSNGIFEKEQMFTENGYDLEEVLVPFDRIKLAESIVSSSLPDKKKIIKFTSLTEDEIRLAMENLGFGTNGRK